MRSVPPFVHLYFNLIGTVVFMILFYTANMFIHFSFLQDSANAAGIAVIHTAFNVFATVIWLPFHRVLERLAILTVRDGKDEERTAGALQGLSHWITVSWRIRRLQWTSAVSPVHIWQK